MKFLTKQNYFVLIALSVTSVLLLHLYIQQLEVVDMILEIGPPQKSTSMIVTAYMNLGRGAKHSESSYRQWISTFMSIETPMVIYTNDIDNIAQLRGNRSTIFVHTTMAILKQKAKWNNDFLWWQRWRDPEIERHPHPDLYVVWDSKTRLVYEASEKYNRWDCEYFFWVDIGSFRGKNTSLRKWPDPDRIKQSLEGQDKALYAAVAIPLYDMLTYNISVGPFTPTFIEGGFFGGNKKAIDRLFVKYYDLRNYFQKQGYFVGKDQNVMGALILLQQEEFLVLNAAFVMCMDPWFFFQQYFAAPTEVSPVCNDSIIPLWDLHSFLGRMNVSWFLEGQ